MPRSTWTILDFDSLTDAEVRQLLKALLEKFNLKAVEVREGYGDGPKIELQDDE